MNATTSSIPETNGPSRNESLSTHGDDSLCDPAGPSVCDRVVSAWPTIAVPGTGVITANATQGWVPAGTCHFLLTRAGRAERPVTGTARSPTLADVTTQCPFPPHEVRRRVWTTPQMGAPPDQAASPRLDDGYRAERGPLGRPGPIQSIRLALVHLVGCEASC